VSGPVDEREAMVVDLPVLDTILQEEVTARLDGRHLDRDVPDLAGILPTCEALARHLFGRIATRVPAGVALARVMVAEDASLQAECLADP
ncbi:MAG: 6-carboxytetrahydropterin synthase, partial [Gemmatimonadales bacterium]|nr:6-carboxytetrahydropterin synthase [Gemmatimonadales bacterium]